MKNKTRREDFGKNLPAFVIALCLLLGVAAGCSLFKRGEQKTGWNMREACGYMDGTGIKFTSQNDTVCSGGGYVRNDRLLYHEPSPKNILYLNYTARGKDNKAEVLELSADSDYGRKEENAKIFTAYGEKLIRKALNTSMPDDVRQSILEIQRIAGAPPQPKTKGVSGNPIIHKIGNAEIRLSTSGAYYDMEISR